MILIIGPYVGSFEYEITVFWPYVLWLCNVVDFKKAYIITHYNRAFLYNNIDKRVEMLPIYKHITRDEEGQIDHRHENITHKDYNLILKRYKEDVIKQENIKKSEVNVINLGYIKNIPNDNIYKKTFKYIDVSDTPCELRGLFIYIPFGKNKENEIIYKYIKSVDDNFVVVGDIKSPLIQENILMTDINYFSHGLRNIIGAISYAKAVICPISFWTLICNIQQSTVFSWGNNPGRYRNGGIYGMNNTKSTIFPNVNLKTLQGYLKGFIEKVRGDYL
jgi:hypothetical protein